MSRRATGVLALALAALLTPAGAEAQIPAVPPEVAWAALGVDVRLEVRRFDLPGRDFAHARRSLALLGPTTEDGSHSHALTTYDVSVRWKLTPGPSGCRAEDVHVVARIVIDLPRWPGARDAPERDARAWTVVEEALTHHENRHRDAALEAAYRLRRKLTDAHARSCSGLTRRVDTVTRQVRRELRAAQAAIDREERGPSSR
ncbi:MAG: DUF922 domain-containing protein [Gemmatimonadota bacterium]|jgi:predicted secreted Zn-dependent protease